MLALSSSDLARVKQLTDRCYIYMHPVVRDYLNEQLEDAVKYNRLWDVTDWFERMECNAKFYEEGPPQPKRRAIRVKNSFQ